MANEYDLDQPGNAIMRAAGDKVRRGKLEKVKGEKQPRKPATVRPINKRPDKHTFNLKSVADVLIDAGLNPAEEILKVMPQLEPDVAARLHAELLQYVQPKLKSVEIKGDPDRPVKVVASMDEDQVAKIARGFLVGK